MKATYTVLRYVANHQPSVQRHMPDNRNPHFIVSVHLFPVQNSDKLRLGLTNGEVLNTANMFYQKQNNLCKLALSS